MTELNPCWWCGHFAQMRNYFITIVQFRLFPFFSSADHTTQCAYQDHGQ